MNKKKITKLGLLILLAVTLILTSSVSATGTNLEVSRVQYFTIQSNVHCGDISKNWQYRSDFMFNVNNISDISTDITVYLYKKDGTLFTAPGDAGYGYATEIIPGTPITIAANSTVQYVNHFGYSSNSNVTHLDCSERPAYGKIVVHSNHGLLMANGEMQGMKYITSTTPTRWEAYNRSTVTVNSGNPF